MTCVLSARVVPLPLVDQESYRDNRVLKSGRWSLEVLRAAQSRDPIQDGANNKALDLQLSQRKKDVKSFSGFVFDDDAKVAPFLHLQPH